jgi:hypothetical protein
MHLKFTCSLALAATLGTGCLTEFASRVNRNWGSAQRDVTASMVINPAGSEVGHDPSAKVDGVTVEHSLDRHRQKEMRQAHPAAPPSVINIGTVSP